MSLTDPSPQSPATSEIQLAALRAERVRATATLFKRGVLAMIDAARADDKATRDELAEVAARALAEGFESCLDEKTRLDRAQNKEIESVREQLKAGLGVRAVGSSILFTALLRLLEYIGKQ